MADRPPRPYPRNPRKNDAAVDRICGSIREFGFKIRTGERYAAERTSATLRFLNNTGGYEGQHQGILPMEAADSATPFACRFNFTDLAE